MPGRNVTVVGPADDTVRDASTLLPVEGGPAASRPALQTHKGPLHLCAMLMSTMHARNGVATINV